MIDLLTWKLIVDAGLALVLLVLAYRFSRGGGAAFPSARMVELERSLKELLKQAESAGSNLNEQLLSRKRSLEKVLYDLETTEHRVNKSLDQADEERKEIQDQIKRARTIGEELRSQIQSTPAASPASHTKAQKKEIAAQPSSEEPLRNRIEVRAAHEPIEEAPPAPSFAATVSQSKPRPAQSEARPPVASGRPKAKAQTQNAQPESRIMIPRSTEEVPAQETIELRDTVSEAAPVAAPKPAAKPKQAPTRKRQTQPAPKTQVQQGKSVPAQSQSAAPKARPQKSTQSNKKADANGVRPAVFRKVDVDTMEGRLFKGSPDKALQAERRRAFGAAKPAKATKQAPAKKAPTPVQKKPPMLAKQIEKEVFYEGSIEDVFAHAEQLLREGESVEQVANYTRLSPADVGMIARMISREGAVEEDTGGEPSIKRGRQTL